MTNPFLELAERQIVGPRKSQLKAVATRSKRVQEKLDAKKEESGILFKQWQKWKDDRRKELMDGPYGEHVATLNQFLDRMTINDADELIDLVASGPWHEADADTKFQVLDMISLTIIYVLENNGLPPLDGSMPFSDDPPTLFETIKEMLK